MKIKVPLRKVLQGGVFVAVVLTLIFYILQQVRQKLDLKVLTNEKRGGLKVVAFDRSPVKLFALRFSNKSVQAPSCERAKTSQRTPALKVLQ
jgi:hypothetical protein